MPPAQIIALRLSVSAASAMQYAHAVHAMGSKVVVVRMAVRPMSAGAMDAAIAAMTAEAVLPPRRRAKSAARGTSAVAAMTAGSRSSHAVIPYICVAAAMSGTSGGWSA